MRRVSLFLLSTVLTAGQVLAVCGGCAPVHCAEGEVAGEVELSQADAAESPERAVGASHCDSAARASEGTQQSAATSGVPSDAGRDAQPEAMACAPDAVVPETSCGATLQAGDEAVASTQTAPMVLLAIADEVAVEAIDPGPPDRVGVVERPTPSHPRLFELHAVYLI